MSLSLLEAVFYAVMVGAGEGYFLADAVRLGATKVQMGLVVSLPLFVGGLGPLAAIAFASRGWRRKPLVVVGASVQALALAIIAFGDAFAALTPTSLIALVCLHQVCSQAGGTAWSSWFGAVVPPEIRGRYFSRRSRRVQVATMLAMLGTGVGLHYIEPEAAGKVIKGAGGLGFVFAFGIAALARGVSALLLALSPEPLPESETKHIRLRTIATSPSAASARKLLLVGAVLQFAVYLSSPYFGSYMLDHLHLSYIEYTVGSLAVVVAKVASIPSWGRVIDTHNPRSVFLLAIVLVALIPLPWLWANGLAWVIVAQCLSGFAWGGHEISQLSLYLEVSRSAIRQHVFALQSFLQGTTQLLGTLAGGLLLGLFTGRYWLLFLVSAVIRAIVSLAAPKLLEHVQVPNERAHRLLLRVIGLRASGELVHRAVDTGDLTPAPQSLPIDNPKDER
jgi:MFS family permease